MKKAYLLVLFFGIFGFAQQQSLSAQEGTTQYVLNGKTISFTNSIDRAIVEFDPATSDLRMAEILDNVGFVVDIDFLPSPKVALTTYDRSITWETVSGILMQYSEVVFVSRGLIYEDGTEEFALNSVFIQLKENESIDRFKSSLFQMGISNIEPSFMPGLFEVSLPRNGGDLPRQIANSLLNERGVSFVEPDMLKLMERMSTNDPALALQWSLNNTGSAAQYSGIAGEDMNVFAAWSTTTGSSSIKVAVLDEGVDLVHPDLMANLLPGFDGHGLNSGEPINDDAHGTACAGIIAGVGNNSVGVAGVAYGCKIIPVRIAYSNSSGGWVTSSSIIGASITWAWQTAGADILSNSWGGGSPTSLIQTPFANAITQGRGGLGSPVLAAAGNSNVTTDHYPSAYPEVMSIAAMSMCGERKNPSSCDSETWWGSNYGSKTSVGAPGVKIYTTDISGTSGYSSGDYAPTFNGTSSACPNAAGVMALVLSANTALTEVQAKNILEGTAEKAGGYSYTTTAGYPNGTWNNELGYGRVDAQAAVLAATGATSVCSFSASLSTSGVTSTAFTIDLTLNVGVANPSYLVEIGPQGFTAGSGQFFPTINPSLSVTGGAANTTYGINWYLVCSSGDTSVPVSTQVTTACGAITAPVSQDFTNITIGYALNYGECWTTTTSSILPRWEGENASGANENSTNTGPNYDNTIFGTAGGNYMYLEVSSPAVLGDSALLYSPFIDVSGLTSPMLSFFYHMYGSTMGSLHVDINSSGVWTRSVIIISGEQQTSGAAPWLEMLHVLSPSSTPIQIRFRGVVERILPMVGSLSHFD